MKRYAIAYFNFFDNDLQIKIVEADGWRMALDKAFPVLYWVREDDLKKAREQAFNSDVLFNVIDIKIRD